MIFPKALRGVQVALFEVVNACEGRSDGLMTACVGGIGDIKALMMG